jgi:hypothetical protein
LQPDQRQCHPHLLLLLLLKVLSKDLLNPRQGLLWYPLLSPVLLLLIAALAVVASQAMLLEPHQHLSHHFLDLQYYRSHHRQKVPLNSFLPSMLGVPGVQLL